MKRLQWLAGSMALAFSLGAGAPSHAADENAPATAPTATTPTATAPTATAPTATTPTATAPTATAPTAAAPDNNAGGDARAEKRRQRQAEAEKRRLELQAMTPADRAQAMQRDRLNGLRQVLIRAGIDDVSTQDAVLDYMSSEEQARQGMNDISRKTMQAVVGKAVTDKEAAIILGNLRDAVQDEKTRRAATAKALDLKIGYSKKPRLEALLTLMGAIGDESFYLGGAPGGRGNGFGRGNGSGRGQGNGRGNGGAQGNRGNANGNQADGAAENKAPANADAPATGAIDNTEPMTK